MSKSKSVNKQEEGECFKAIVNAASAAAVYSAAAILSAAAIVQVERTSKSKSQSKSKSKSENKKEKENQSSVTINVVILTFVPANISSNSKKETKVILTLLKRVRKHHHFFSVKSVRSVLHQPWHWGGCVIYILHIAQFSCFNGRNSQIIFSSSVRQGYHILYFLTKIGQSGLNKNAKSSNFNFFVVPSGDLLFRPGSYLDGA